MLSPGDAKLAGALVREAGWNQVDADWRLMIETGEAVGLFTQRGTPEQLVATALSLPHGPDFAWISMVLVSAAWRRRGLATTLLRDRIDAVVGRGATPMLDATEDGREVYLPLGFRDLYPISRLQVDELPHLARPPHRATPISELDLETLRTWDADRFGADRCPVLQAIRERAPERAWILRHAGGDIAGYVLGRDGLNASQIGPLMAEDTESPRELLEAAMTDLAGPVFIDVPDRHGELTDWLGGLGFTRQRGFVRMAHERDQPFDNPDATFVIAGPELG